MNNALLPFSGRAITISHSPSVNTDGQVVRYESKQSKSVLSKQKSVKDMVTYDDSSRQLLPATSVDKHLSVTALDEYERTARHINPDRD